MTKDELKLRDSKVAFCPICNGFVIAGLTEFDTAEDRAEYEEALKDGFCLIIETREATKRREFVSYSECKNKHLTPTTPEEK